MSRSQFHSIKLFILRHAWLNLWDKHMTTGRINQVTFLSTLTEPKLHQCSHDQREKTQCQHTTKVSSLIIFLEQTILLTGRGPKYWIRRTTRGKDKWRRPSGLQRVVQSWIGTWGPTPWALSTGHWFPNTLPVWFHLSLGTSHSSDEGFRRNAETVNKWVKHWIWQV